MSLQEVKDWILEKILLFVMLISGLIALFKVMWDTSRFAAMSNKELQQAIVEEKLNEFHALCYYLSISIPYWVLILITLLAFALWPPKRND